METASERFGKISANFVTSEVHRSSPTIARLHELLASETLDSVCDVACGAGHLALSFAERASRLVVVDPADNMLAAAVGLAQERGIRVEAHRASAERLPLKSEDFDLTCSRLAPHHFGNIDMALREMCRVTKLTGCVAVIDLQGSEDAQADAFNHRLEVLHDPTHVRSYTVERWKQAFRQAGLEIVTVEPNLSERPSGVPVKRWCEIASSGQQAEDDINALLAVADPEMLDKLGIRREEATWLLPIRTVLILGRKRVNPDD